MTLFPERPPYNQGMLDVGEGQQIYWEEYGNPMGKPAVVLHGGPGSGCTRQYRQFDPAAYRIVQFDQRGSGRSTPRVHTGTSLRENTTLHLIADIERLRNHVGVDSWLVWGGSWGVTLALAYAEAHPNPITEMVLASVTMSRPAEIHWLYHEAGRFFPEEWERFRQGVPEADRHGDLVAAYYRLVNENRDPKIREKAAQSWCDWEDAVQSLEEGWAPNPRYADPAFRMTFARIVTHYFHHHAWLEDGQILRNAYRLARIPGVLIHGRFDIGGPPDTAWQLAQVWPAAKLHLVRTGHGGGDEMTARVLEATSEFAHVGTPK